MSNQMSNYRFVGICLLASVVVSPVMAAQREGGKGDNAAVQKLQTMVKSLTSERDAAKAEVTKVTAELDQIKKDSAKSAAAADAAKEQLGSELAAQKTSNDEVRDRLEKTNSRLLEVIDKYKALSQSKNELANELAQFKQKYEVSEQQLATCTEHNVKLYESGKDLLEHYQSKGTFSGLLQDEPVLQFNNVDMENIIQEYEDKLRSGQYNKK